MSFCWGVLCVFDKNISRKPRTSPKASGVLKKTVAVVQIQQILRTLQSFVQTLEEVVFLILTIEIFSLAATKMVHLSAVWTSKSPSHWGEIFSWVRPPSPNQETWRSTRNPTNHHWFAFLFGIPRILQRQNKKKHVVKWRIRVPIDFSFNLPPISCSGLHWFFLDFLLLSFGRCVWSPPGYQTPTGTSCQVENRRPDFL